MSLGSIVVRLTLNTADFETDAGRAAKVADRRAKEIDASFRKAGVAIGAALGTAILGVSKIIKDGIDRMDEMSKAAQKVGLPTEEFSRLAYAGELADVSMDTLVSSLGRLTKAQAASLKETSQQARVFDALGISVKDADGNLRNSSDVLLDFADRFNALKGSPEAMAAGFALFGRSFQDMVPLIKDGSGAMRELMEESDALGKTISTEAGQAAEEFNDNLTRLKGAFQGVAFSLAEDLLPELIGLTEQALDWIRDGDNAKQITDDLSDGFRALADVVGVFIQVGAGLGTVRDSLAGIENAWRSLTDFGLNSTVGDALKEMIPWAYKTIGGTPSFSNVRSGPDFSNVQGGADVASQSVDASRLRLALGGGPAKAGGSKKAQLTEEQKAAKELDRAYQSLLASQAERIALFGTETEVAKVTYETQHGDLKALDEARKQSLLTQAAELDALEERQKLEEDGKRLIEGLLEPFEQINAEREEAAKLLRAGVIAQEDYNRAIEASRTPAEQMLEDMQFELELLGKTREEQELLTAARYLGAEAMTDQGKAALAAMADFQAAAKQNQEVIDFADGMRDSFGDFFTSMIDGSKSAKDAFKDLVTDILAQITRMMVNKAIEQMFGSYGSTQGGQSGINWGSLVGSLFGGSTGSSQGSLADLFGGAWGFANGGTIGSNSVARINERGFEMATVGGSDYLLTGNSPVRITPHERLGVGGIRQTNILNVQGRVTRRTEERMAQLTGREAQRALARTGR